MSLFEMQMLIKHDLMLIFATSWNDLLSSLWMEIKVQYQYLDYKQSVCSITQPGISGLPEYLWILPVIVLWFAAVNSGILKCGSCSVQASAVKTTNLLSEICHKQKAHMEPIQSKELNRYTPTVLS